MSMSEREAVTVGRKVHQTTWDEEGIEVSYNVHAEIDEDGHLNIYVNSNDGSSVQWCAGDGDDEMFRERFTTEKIETRYREITGAK